MLFDSGRCSFVRMRSFLMRRRLELDIHRSLPTLCASEPALYEQTGALRNSEQRRAMEARLWLGVSRAPRSKVHSGAAADQLRYARRSMSMFDFIELSSSVEAQS
jgi:hypothetical protein